MATTRIRTSAATPDLVERWIEQDEGKPGRHNARLTAGPRVWLVIGTLQRLDWDVAKAASEWMIPEEAVLAAIRYYEQHRPLFDAKLLLEAEEEDA